ncbi:hypothetical protein Tco_0671848 [Tanacetum coccineum]
MMTFLKHVGNFKHSELKSKKFEDIQAMYEKIKRSDEDFIAIGSIADERLIQRMNKKDSSKLRMKKEWDYRDSWTGKFTIKNGRQSVLELKPQPNQAEPIEDINLNVVTRSNGQKRYFSTLTTVLSIFDREDLNVVYQLVMDKYQDEMPEGFERVLWGDLMVLFNPDEQDEFWNSQHKSNVISWKLHSSSGVHTLMTEEGD